MTASEYLLSAIQHIDARLGEGYAKAHPEPGTTTMEPMTNDRNEFWDHLEVSFEDLRDAGRSGLLHSMMHNEYPKRAAELEADTARNAAWWAMLRYALEVCKDS